MKALSIVAAAASLVLLGGCKNGPNNGHDTTGMPNSTAAGSIPNGATAGDSASAATAPNAGGSAAVSRYNPPAAPADSGTVADSLRKQTRKKP